MHVSTHLVASESTVYQGSTCTSVMCQNDTGFPASTNPNPTATMSNIFRWSIVAQWGLPIRDSLSKYRSFLMLWDLLYMCCSLFAMPLTRMP